MHKRDPLLTQAKGLFYDFLALKLLQKPQGENQLRNSANN